MSEWPNHDWYRDLSVSEIARTIDNNIPHLFQGAMRSLPMMIKWEHRRARIAGLGQARNIVVQAMRSAQTDAGKEALAAASDAIQVAIEKVKDEDC